MIWPGHRRAAALAAAVALGVAGCITDAPTPSEVPTATPEPEATPTITIYELDETVWYAGLILTFGTATATLDAKGGDVQVDVTLENPGAELGSLEGPIRLVTEGTAVEPNRDSHIPDVPAAGGATASVTFDVDPSFDVPGAAIQVGRPEEHQAVVPLAARAIEVVTLEPLAIAVTGEAQAGSLFVKLTQVELRADLPDWSQELPEAVMALTLTYDASFRSTFTGGFAFTGANVALRLPDGTTVDPRRDGRSQSVVVISAAKPEVGLRSRFEVPSPGAGTYALVIKDGSATKDLPFEIVLPESRAPIEPR